MSANDVEDLPVQGDSSGHDNGRSVSESKEEQASGHSIISREMSAFFAQSGQRYHPIFDKFESEHVSQFLKNSHDLDAATRRQLSTDRFFRFAYFFFIVGLLVFLTIFLLPDNREIFVDILKAVSFLTAGGLGGYGYGFYKYRSESRERGP